MPLSTKQLVAPMKQCSLLLKQRACLKLRELNWLTLQASKLVLLAISTQTTHDSLQRATVCSVPKPIVVTPRPKRKLSAIILANSPIALLVKMRVSLNSRGCFPISKQPTMNSLRLLDAWPSLVLVLKSRRLRSVHVEATSKFVASR